VYFSIGALLRLFFFQALRTGGSVVALSVITGPAYAADAAAAASFLQATPKRTDHKARVKIRFM
jgi:hypothetical protein